MLRLGTGNPTPDVCGALGRAGGTALSVGHGSALGPNDASMERLSTVSELDGCGRDGGSSGLGADVEADVQGSIVISGRVHANEHLPVEGSSDLDRRSIGAASRAETERNAESPIPFSAGLWGILVRPNAVTVAVTVVGAAAAKTGNAAAVSAVIPIVTGITKRASRRRDIDSSLWMGSLLTCSHCGAPP
jgi:hypothetical protein